MSSATFTLLFCSQKEPVTQENRGSEGFSQPAQDDTERRGQSWHWKLGLQTPGPQLLFTWALQPPRGCALPRGQRGHQGVLPGTEELLCGRGASPLPRLPACPALGWQDPALCFPSRGHIPWHKYSHMVGAGRDLETAWFVSFLKAAEPFSKWNYTWKPNAKHR